MSSYNQNNINEDEMIKALESLKGLFASKLQEAVDKELSKEEANTKDLDPAMSYPSYQGAGIGMNYLLELQKSVESAWGRMPNPDRPEEVSQYIREVVLCATDELHELLNEVHWKPWKPGRGIKDMAKYREELADVLHFIFDLYLAAGLTGEDLVSDYIKKHRTNMERTKNDEYRNS